MRAYRLSETFRKFFGQKPTQWYSAPGRVALMGFHQLPASGVATSLATNRDTSLAIRPNDKNQIRLYSMNDQAGFSLDLDYTPQDSITGWQRHLKAVIWAMTEAGYEIQPFDGVLHSTLPFGSKLGSGVALQALLALVIRDQNKSDLNGAQLARLCLHAHTRFSPDDPLGPAAYYPVFTAERGQASLVRVATKQITHHPFPTQWQVAYVHLPGVADASVLQRERLKRRLADVGNCLGPFSEWTASELSQHQGSLMPETAATAHAVLAEGDRATRLATAIEEQDIGQARQLMQVSREDQHTHLIPETPEMTKLLDAMACAPGIIGVRPAQEPGSGCAVALVEKEQWADFVSGVESSVKDVLLGPLSILDVESGACARQVV